MLPLLRLAADGLEHLIAATVDQLAEQFKLTPGQRSALLPSGRQPVFYNRVHWAKTYLRQAGLLESTRRGRFRITIDGQHVLRDGPPHIDVKFLERYDAFRAFRERARDTDSSTADPQPPGGPSETPEERLTASHRQLREALAVDLLDRVRDQSPAFFERLVLDLLVRMGYGGSFEDAALAVGQTGDGGIDGIIKEDRLGLDTIYIQAKKWSSNVGRPDVQQFVGSLSGQHATKGVMISTSEFTSDAKDYVRFTPLKLVLIGGEELARLMIDHGVGVTEAAVYRVFRVDTDYFGED